MKKFLVIAVVAALAACSKPESDPAPAALPKPETTTVPNPPAATPVVADSKASVMLTSTEGNTATGTLDLVAEGDGVHIRGEIRGLTPDSEHGFHIHEKGDCTAADASSAGGHFNPDGHDHGKPDGAAHHAGDIFNIKADASGVATVDAVAKVSLRSGTANDALGKAIVVHAKADDYTSQPAGDSGPRIACGVIQ